MSTSSLDLAKRYWVDDILSAATTGTRLNKILESFAKGLPLTAASKSFLTEYGLNVLAGFAGGEIAEREFNQLAPAERETRIAAVQAQLKMKDAQIQADKVAASAREVDMWLGLEAKRTKRDSDPKFIARQKNRELRLKYGVDGFVNEHDFVRLMSILRRLETGSRLSEEDAVWLKTEGREYASREMEHAYNRVEADFCLAEYRQTGDVWKAVSASGHLRKCDASSEAHELLAAIPNSRLSQPKLGSAVRTTHGGAMRDLGRYDGALKLGEEAHALQPDNFRPCTLMGALNIELGNIEAGHEWYRKAEERGAEADSIESDLRFVIARMSQEKRKDMTRQLIGIDPVRYGWLRRWAAANGN